MSVWLPDIRALLDVGTPELIILGIIVIALLFLGPTKLPQLMRGVGRAMGEFRRGREEIEREIRREMYETPVASPKVPLPPRREIMRAAEELGVRTEGMEEKDVKLEIVRAMDRESTQRVIAAAKVLGLSTDGQQLSDLKMSIIKSIAT